MLIYIAIILLVSFVHQISEFRGALKDAELDTILVIKQMNKNLREFLERHRGKLTIQGPIRISRAFLHQLTTPMVHCDLNGKNVMFTFDGVIKIGNFGQSKLKQDLYLTVSWLDALFYI